MSNIKKKFLLKLLVIKGFLGSNYFIKKQRKQLINQNIKNEAKRIENIFQ